MNIYPPKSSAAADSSALVRRAMFPSSTVPHAAERFDFEVQIHSLEIRAYVSVLQAFSAQSNALTWEKEQLMSDMRKELRISDAEHRELLGKINSDETVKAIRQWRNSDSCHQPLLPESVNKSLVAPNFIGNNSSGHNKQKNTKITITSSGGYYPQLLSAPVQPSVALAPYGDEDCCADDSGTYYTRGNVEQLRVPVANSRQMHPYIAGRKPLAPVKVDGNVMINREEILAPVKKDGNVMMNREKNLASMIDGNVMMNREEILQIFDTDMVIRKAMPDECACIVAHYCGLHWMVEQICQTGTHDPSMMKKARHLLKVHEQSLVTAIEKLSDYTAGQDPIEPEGFQNQALTKRSGQTFHPRLSCYPRK